MQVNGPVCKKYTLKYWGSWGYQVGNSLSSDSGEKMAMDYNCNFSVSVRQFQNKIVYLEEKKPNPDSQTHMIVEVAWCDNTPWN